MQWSGRSGTRTPVACGHSQGMGAEATARPARPLQSGNGFGPAGGRQQSGRAVTTIVPESVNLWTVLLLIDKSNYYDFFSSSPFAATIIQSSVCLSGGFFF